MVFGSADDPLCRESAVVLRGGILEGEEDGAKKGGKIGRGFIVNHEEGKRVREGFEKGDDRRKGGDVRGGGAGFERGEVNVPVVNSDEYVLVTVHRFDGKTTCQIGRGPLILVAGVGETGQGFVIRVGWRGGIGKGSGVDGGV